MLEENWDPKGGRTLLFISLFCCVSADWGSLASSCLWATAGGGGKRQVNHGRPQVKHSKCQVKHGKRQVNDGKRQVKHSNKERKYSYVIFLYFKLKNIPHIITILMKYE